MKHLTEPTRQLTVCMAGNYADALRACREYALRVGLCVTVTPTEYVYTGGQEAGFLVGLINYPRFPSSESELFDHAYNLMLLLLDACCQQSASIIMPAETHWFSRRPE